MQNTKKKVNISLFSDLKLETSVRENFRELLAIRAEAHVYYKQPTQRYGSLVSLYAN